MLTILITTHNRVRKLEKSLDAISASCTAGIVSDIVVVDDGSSDGTPLLLQQKLNDGLVSTVVRNEFPRGPATGRNQGIRQAKGNYTLIMGDDVVLFPSSIELFWNHVQRYDLDNASVIGNIMPVPDEMTAFEYWSCNGGSQFGHNRIPDDRIFDAGDEHFYTSNVVTPTSLLLQHPFEESFRYARYEDRELAYRLRREVNHKVHYLAEAKSYHDHRYSFRDWLSSFERFTWSALHFSSLYPEDLSLKKKLGIDKAVECTTFHYQSLQDSVRIINRYHHRFFSDDTIFGQPWQRDLVMSSFRMVQEFFRTNNYRQHLNLEVLHDHSNAINADSAMSDILEELDKEA
ncbi:glycosyltransferase [bacterium]|nr:glycosyltransferase [bacterium]